VALRETKPKLTDLRVFATVSASILSDSNWEFIVYAQNHPEVVFIRKDEIARFALSNQQTTREGI
jgi:hypothetical protein